MTNMLENAGLTGNHAEQITNRVYLFQGMLTICTSKLMVWEWDYHHAFPYQQTNGLGMGMGLEVSMLL